jgi:hypothetical protein
VSEQTANPTAELSSRPTFEHENYSINSHWPHDSLHFGSFTLKAFFVVTSRVTQGLLTRPLHLHAKIYTNFQRRHELTTLRLPTRRHHNFAAPMSHCRLPLRIKCCAHSPLLPFLYQTRSIHHLPTSRRHIPEDDLDEIPLENAPPPKEEDPFAYLYEAPKKRDTRPVPPSLGNGAPFRKSFSPHQQAPSGAGSITLREREIFTKIFETILSTPSAGNKLPTSQDSTPRARGLPPPPQLQELFASTIGPQQTGTGALSFAPRQRLSEREGGTAAMALASTLEAYPPSLRLAAARVAGLKNYNPLLQGDQGATDRGLLDGLMKELRACWSDVDVLRFLEEKVYPLPADPSSAGAMHYADLLAEGMRIFREVYHDLGSVVAVFERAKSLGAESYVLGCTTPVYNKALAAVWDGFQDVQRVRDMVEEMAVNAVGGDLTTADIIRNVCDEVEAAHDGQRGELAQMMVGEHEMHTVATLRKRATNLERYRSLEGPPREKKKQEAPKKKLSRKPIKWADKEGGKWRGKGKRKERAGLY